MWFRLVAALSLLAFLGMVWMLVFSTKEPPPSVPFKPVSMETK